MASQRATGTVKFFDTEKGFGFIGRRHGEDVFIHISDVQRSGLKTLFEGQHVDFDIKQTPKGPQAQNVEAHEFERQLPPEIEPATVEPSSLASVFYAAALHTFESEDLDPEACEMWNGKSLASVDPGFRVDLNTADSDAEGDLSLEQKLEKLEKLGEVAGLRVARDDVVGFLREHGEQQA
jgi:CspA family cold shock protein